jgi:hypothetical protein
MKQETITKFGIMFLKAAAVIGIAATGAEIVRKHWNPSKTLFPNLRATVPALLALAYATNKGMK